MLNRLNNARIAPLPWPPLHCSSPLSASPYFYPPALRRRLSAVDLKRFCDSMARMQTTGLARKFQAQEMSTTMASMTSSWD